MLKYITYLLSIAGFLVACNGCNPTKNNEIESLKLLLNENSDSVSSLTQTLTKSESKNAEMLINEHLNAALKEDYSSQWENKTLVLNEHQLKFKYKTFGQKPPGGWSLYISMHGGGGAPPAVNDKQWENQINLYKPKEGIYMAPRAPTDTWNLWHREHIDIFFARFIALADVFEDINTNRIYLTGYSAGGDGTYQLAPRMADYFAAAAMMAGHPNDASPLGLRNLPFAIHMGAEDGAYDRNKIAADWGKKLDDLQAADPSAYIHDVQIHSGMGHWMERKDTVAIDWMAQFNRNAYPEKIVWKQSSVTHNRFYWLAVPEGKAIKDAEVIAVRNKQIISIEKADLVNELIIRLNDTMLDLDKTVTIKYKGNVIYNEVPNRTIATIWKTLTEKNDLNQVFCTEIQVSLN